MDGAVFLICLLFGLRCSSIGADRLLGGDRIGEGTTTSWRVLANEYLLDLPLPVSVPSMSHCCLAFSADPPILVGKFSPGSYEVSTFLAGSWCTQAPSKSGASVYLCRIPVIKLYWHLKLDFLEVPPPAVRPTGCKSWPGAQDFHPLGEHSWYNYFPVCGSPTQGVQDLILLLFCFSYHLFVASSLSLGVRYLSW